MIAELIHFLILLVLLTILCFFCCRKRNLRRKYKILLVVLVLGISKVNAANVPPIENLFLRYHSPESAFSYLGWGEYIGLEKGEKSVLLISRYHSEDKFLYLEQQNGKYQAPFQAPKEKTILNPKKDSTIITLIPETGTTAYYIIVFTTSAFQTQNSDTITITDSQKSDFQQLQSPNQNKEIDSIFYLYSTYVDHIDESYFIDINGTQYDVKQEETAFHFFSQWFS